MYIIYIVIIYIYASMEYCNYIYIYSSLYNMYTYYTYLHIYIYIDHIYIHIYICSIEYTQIPCSKVVWPKVSRLCLQLSQHCQHLRRLSLSVPWRNGSVGFQGDFMGFHGISLGKMVVSLRKIDKNSGFTWFY